MNKLPYAMLKDDGTPINQDSPGLLRTLTPAGGAQVREYADVTNAATVGTIEIGKTFNVAINTTTGVWDGRDTTGECWLERWTDTGALKEYWYAAPATAGIVPTWVKTHSVDVTTGATIVGDATLPGHAVRLDQVGVLPQNIQSVSYTTILSDAGKHILHPSADTSARTFTIAANTSVPYRVGTAITIVNQNGAGVITIGITTDVMRLAGAGTTGNRTLAANGVATALKVTATEWIISGTGLS